MSVKSSLFHDFLLWVEEHVDALEEDVLEADDNGVLGSLRCIVKGDLGCTEEVDYTPERWAVMQAIRSSRV